MTAEPGKPSSREEVNAAEAIIRELATTTIFPIAKVRVWWGYVPDEAFLRFAIDHGAVMGSASVVDGLVWEEWARRKRAAPQRAPQQRGPGGG